MILADVFTDLFPEMFKGRDRTGKLKSCKMRAFQNRITYIRPFTW